jgi:hypothetical protein
MKKLIASVLVALIATKSFNQDITTRFEQSNGKQTPTYFEIIDWW